MHIAQGRNPNRIRATAEDKIVNTVIFLFMLFVLIVTAYPFYYTLVMSFNEGNDALRGGIYFWPRAFTLENYQKFITDQKWILGFLTSVARTVVGTICSVLFTCLVAYAMSFRDLKLRKFYYIIMITCMYFSGGLIPYYLTIRSIGLLNSFWVYILPGIYSIYNMILAISFFESLPRALYESAYLDGANDFTIYIKIVLPLSKPLLATLALFVAVNQWNAWTDTAFFCVGDKNLRTLAYLLREVIVSNSTGADQVATMTAEAAARMDTTTTRSIQMAAMVIAVFPIMCVYPFLQKYFISGIMLGAVKE